MQIQSNVTQAPEVGFGDVMCISVVLGLRVVCCGEGINTRRLETNCRECGASARQKFALLHDLREKVR
jgi:hypothetical protein